LVKPAQEQSFHKLDVMDLDFLNKESLKIETRPINKLVRAYRSIQEKING
jgi:hypothetical protein